MAAPPKGEGIADDASSYEDAPEPDAKKRPPPARRNSSIAGDAKLFEDILEESTDAARTLDTNWLYQLNGQVFGPVKPKELLEMLYDGQMNADTLVAVENGEFLPLNRIGVFRVHLPKVEKHQRDVAEAKAREKRDQKRRWMRWASWAAVAVIALGVGGWGVMTWVRKTREEAVAEEKAAKEAALREQLDGLLATVIIEPPLMALVDEEEEERAKNRRRGKKSGGDRAVARFSGGTAQATGDLTRQEIMEGVGQAFGGFKRCIVEQIQRDRESVPEQIVLTFSVNNEGQAQDVSLTDRFLRKSPLRDCLARGLGGVRWRAYKGEVRNVEYPITIGPH